MNREEEKWVGGGRRERGEESERTAGHLVGVNQDKEVVNSDSKHKEGHNFNDNEGPHDSDVAEEPQGS